MDICCATLNRKHRLISGYVVIFSQERLNTPMSERYKRLYHGSRTQLAMAQRLRKNHDFLKLLAKCTPAQRKAILKVADEALVRTICECILNVLKETVPVSKPAKRKLLAHKKSLIALAEKSTPLRKKNFGATGRKLFRFIVTTRATCAKLDSHLKMNYTRRMVLVPENTLERMQQRQQILTPPVTQTLKNLDSEMNDILSSKQLNDEEKAKLYNQVLQRYLTYYDQRKGQPLHVKLATPKSLETPKPEEIKESSKESSEVETTIPTAVEEEVMKSEPKLYKTGARQLLDKIKENRDVLNWNEKGELMYEKKPITGSHEKIK